MKTATRKRKTITEVEARQAMEEFEQMLRRRGEDATHSAWLRGLVLGYLAGLLIGIWLYGGDA